jgi:tetratricopeptide (TPR) repeat protein
MVPGSASRGFDSDLLWQKAQTALARGQLENARQVLTAYQTLGRGNDIHAGLLAGQVALIEDRIRDGTRHVLDAARIAPDDPQTLCAVAGMLLQVGENVAALECLDRPSLAGCEDPLLLMQLATHRRRLQQHAEGLALLDRAKSLGSADPALRYMRGEALLHSGRLGEAEAELASCLADAPDRGRVAVPLVGLRRQTPERNYLAALDAGARIAPPGTNDQAAFEFARYKTLEDLGRDDEAWQALARGNALMRARLPEVLRQHHPLADRFLEACPVAPGAPGPATDSGAQPIFIIGMPRSGTTVLERMLGNHSRVRAAGELMDFATQLQWAADTRDLTGESFMSRVSGLDYAELGRRYLARTQWHARGKAFFIDKQPPNWMWAAAIHLALPQAPILNLVRDPTDVCFSHWRTYFGDSCAYSHDFDTLAGVYNDYRRAMAHWHRIMPGAILDVSYEELVREPEAILRKVFDFCGLEWEAGCADITRNAAPSATPSAVQVRSSLHDRAFGQWRRYEAQLQPLADALGVVAEPGTKASARPRIPDASEAMGTSGDNQWARINHYLATRQFVAARTELESILASDPASAPAHLLLSGVYSAEGRPRLAARHALAAARHPPADPMLLGELVGGLLKVGEMVEARRLLDDPMIATSIDANVLVRTARQRKALGEHHAALALIERAASAGAGGPTFLFQRATQLLFNGRFDEAEAELERCIASGSPPARAYLELATLRTQTAGRNHLRAIKLAIEHTDPGSEDHAFLEFAYYKELEDLGRFDEAWRALERGNAVLHALMPYDIERESAMFDRLIELCTPEFLRQEAGGAGDGPWPIFVVGMPRSGTTVVERILGNHSQIVSAGELVAFPRALGWEVDHESPGVLDGVTIERLGEADWAAVGRRYHEQTRWHARGNAFYVDKLPPNWILAGLIHKALPGARIINLMREGVSVCFSNWRACLGTHPEYRYAYGLESLVAQFRQHRRLMAHWHRALPGKILDVDYARLVHDPEGTARDIFAFCGLPFEPNCSDIAGNRAPVSSLSAPQVRQPIHTQSSASWKPYAAQLEPLVSALSSSAEA